MNVVPHAHDELLQIGTDPAFRGCPVYVGWQIMFAGMLVWRGWRRAIRYLKAVAAAAAAGCWRTPSSDLRDAITLFDRFTWAYWLLVGLGGGAYVLACRRAEPAKTLCNLSRIW